LRPAKTPLLNLDSPSNDDKDVYHHTPYPSPNRKHEKDQGITNGHLLFVMGALILQRAQKCEVRQVTKDVVKSEV